MSDLQHLQQRLAELADPAIAVHSARFFKTGPGEYGEGDKFLGIRVPKLRKLVGQYRNLPIQDVVQLLQSSWHEKRLLAALILVARFQQGGEVEQEEIYTLYLEHIPTSINNWDIIDTHLSTHNGRMALRAGSLRSLHPGRIKESLAAPCSHDGLLLFHSAEWFCRCR